MAATNDAPVRANQATDYVVLERRVLKDEDGNDVKAWVEAGTTTNAVRVNAATDVAADKEGRWRPIPVRNWGKAIRTYTKTETKTVAEEADDD
jgi:hypothetical protein